MVSVSMLGEPSQKFRDTYSITVFYAPIRGVTR